MKNQTTPTGVVVSMIEDLVLSTLQGLANFKENIEKT